MKYEGEPRRREGQRPKEIQPNPTKSDLSDGSELVGPSRPNRLTPTESDQIQLNSKIPNAVERVIQNA